ncbi:MAG: EamA family transporter [Candidatus Rokubacteria bacterium]|nr:EamA family transporter [Candidatus Rokubacteria bacterium]
MLTGLVLIALAAVSWGTTGATMTLLARHAAADPLLVGFARLAIAAPFLLAAARVSTRDWRITGRDLLALLVMGGAMAGYQVFYFRAVMLTGVAVAALLAICSAPLMIAGLATIFLRERLTAAIGLSLAMAVAGTTLLVVGPRGLGEITPGFAMGSALALGAGLSYAIYAVVGKATLAGVAPLPLAGVTFTVAALALAPVLWWAPVVAEPLAKGWPLFLYLALVPTALAYGLYTVGLRRTPATVAGITTLLEPLTASTLGVVLFGERLGVAGTFGAVLLLAAIALLVVRR